MKKTVLTIPIVALFALVALAPGFAAPTGEDTGGNSFGGPDATENLIEDDATVTGSTLGDRLVQGWFDWKAEIQERHGFGLGLDYSSVWLGSSKEGLSGEDGASSGMVRIFGAWELVNRGGANSGAFVWKAENRHRYGSIPPSAFGFEQGYVGMFVPSFSDQGGVVSNLYWRQRLAGGKVTLVGGLLDATDYVDVNAFASPWTGFVNFAFSTGSAATFVPNNVTAGLAAGAMLTEKFYVIGGITNAYADVKRPFKSFDYLSDGEYFKSIEIGLTPARGRIYNDNLHVTYWHVDASDKAGTPGGWGLNGQYIRTFGDRLMPFLRAGYAKDGGSLLQGSVTLGMGYAMVGGRDQLGFAGNWGQPNESSFGPDLKDQYTFECFYRWQLGEQLAITPDIQLLLDPALNPDHDSLWIYGLRARLAL